MLPLPPPPRPEPQPHGKDTRALYTAFCTALGYTNPSKIERGRINAAIRDLPDDATPDQVQRRTAIFLKESQLTFIGPQGIVGNWSHLAALDKPRRTSQPSYQAPQPIEGGWSPPPADVRAILDATLRPRPVTPEGPRDAPA